MTFHTPGAKLLPGEKLLIKSGSRPELSDVAGGVQNTAMSVASREMLLSMSPGHPVISGGTGSAVTSNHIFKQLL